ncbi:MAG TPA: acyltransferase [Ferruginibacter sp.]|nr:acyltransferase [Ferruginibacter sp.]HPH93029.1 acyltransferase [Ferruginibacter sp.]
MKNWKLEFIRGMAALLVFVCHFVSINPVLKSNKNLNLISNWGTEAVIIFFVLSGLVINIVQKKKHSGRKQFILNRLLRIYPQYAAGILLAVIAAKITGNAISWQSIIGAFCFTSTIEGHISTVPVTNPVIWSLSFEFFFYVVYALTIGKWQQKLLFSWFAIALCCIPAFYVVKSDVSAHFVSMFAFSGIWLLGYYIYEYRNRLIVQNIKVGLLFASLLPAISRYQLSPMYYDVGKYFLFALATAPLFVYSIQDNYSQKQKTTLKISSLHGIAAMLLVFAGLYFFSHSRGIANLLYVALPLAALIYMLIPGLLLRQNMKLKQFAHFFGFISYSVYIIHFPILLIISYFTGSNYILYATIGIPLIFALSYLLESKYQAFFNRLFRQKNSSQPL